MKINERRSGICETLRISNTFLRTGPVACNAPPDDFPLKRSQYCRAFIEDEEHSALSTRLHFNIDLLYLGEEEIGKHQLRLCNYNTFG